MITPSLTAYERQLVADPHILIAKNTIIKKVYQLFGTLSEEYKNEVASTILSKQDFITPKISRGENYQGLPYVVLDFPRQFGKEDVFAIRSFFWWGNFFSITLHLAGCYQQQYSSVIYNAISNNLFSGWYIATGENQWEHHFETNNYLSLTEARNDDIDKLPFLKMAKKIPLSKWDEANTFFTENFSLLIKMLESYAPIL
ncbi:hypothetical protein [Segetibacter koreensis]|uniref:hypothetical protein n=1 Tax=Segetibacter koreensis TaxID=398037 RepID=UPI00036AF00F|nr:hypothetical protein [Segetibacter koreensis]